MATRRKDYYELLGIGRCADEKMIKAAYRRLALKYHPDVAKGNHAAERFREIHEAYAVLSNPEQRARYNSLWAADRARRWHAGSPRRGERAAKATVRSYSVGLGGLGIRLDVGWRSLR